MYDANGNFFFIFAKRSGVFEWIKLRVSRFFVLPPLARPLTPRSNAHSGRLRRCEEMDWARECTGIDENFANEMIAIQAFFEIFGGSQVEDKRGD